MSCSDVRSLQPTSEERRLVAAGTLNRISQRVPCRERTASVLLLRVESTKSDFKGKKSKYFIRGKVLCALTISRWRKMSCSSRLGFNPSTFLINDSSASRNCGFEIMNGADTHGYLDKRQNARITHGTTQRTAANWITSLKFPSVGIWPHPDLDRSNAGSGHSKSSGRGDFKSTWVRRVILTRHGRAFSVTDGRVSIIP